MTAEKVVGAKYVMVDNSDYFVEKYPVGTVITLIDDDGTTMPLFSDADGNKQYVRMRDVVKLNIDGEEPVKKTVKTLTQEEFDSIEVGDKVTVRADLHSGLAVRNGVVTSMTELAGKTVTVTGLCNGDVKVDGRPQYWSKEMFTAVIKQEKPKFAVGDIVTTDGVLGTADWDIARRVTAVNMETHKYEMEWADGVVAEIDSPISFIAADAFLTHYTGKVPTAEQSHITAEQFAAIKVGDKLKLRTDMEVGKCYGSMKWLPEKADLAARGVTPVVTCIDSDDTVKADAEGDFWWYSAEMIAEVISAEPEFDCPELVYGNIYTDDDGWTFRYTKTSHTFVGAKVTGPSHLAPTGRYCGGNNKWIHFHEWRKATAEEVAKLEAAEKENGYVPPLVNKVGTVIEADKAYYMKGGRNSAHYVLMRVNSINGNSFTGTLVDWRDRVKENWEIGIRSPYGQSAVPATKEQIALYDAAVALHEAQKAFKEVA